jgi:hypothetical protein
MGISVKKIMGYGFDDIVRDDPRFTVSPEKYSEFHEKLNDEKQQKLFIEHLLDRDEMKSRYASDYYALYDLKRARKKITLQSYDFMKYDDDGGMPNVFIMKPLFGYNDWSRFDDSIDHAERPQRNKLEVQRFMTFYPFASYVDSQTGEIFNDRIFNAIRHINDCLDNKTNPDAPNDGWNSLYECSGKKYKTFKEYEKFVFPAKPASIIEYANFFKIFKDDKIVHTMKPMIYTYWS